VVIDEPLINHYGGVVAAPAVRRIADQSMRYLGISPRFEKSQEALAKKGEEKAGGGPDRVLEAPHGAGGGEEPEAMPPVGVGQVRAPDLQGMDMARAMRVLAEDGLRPVFMGSGIAVEQIPPPRDPVDEGGYVQVNFAPAAQEQSGGGPDDRPL